MELRLISSSSGLLLLQAHELPGSRKDYFPPSEAGAQAEWAVWQWSTPKWVHLCCASTDLWSKTLTFFPMSTSLPVPWFKVRYLWMPTSSAWSTCSRDPARLESQLQMLPVQAASYLHQRVFLMTNRDLLHFSSAECVVNWLLVYVYFNS